MGGHPAGPASKLLLACALPLLLAAAAFPGDPVVARNLLENGKKVVNARKFDEANTLLRKALEEDPGLAEAAYWIATARERNRDETGALAAYREFLAILEKKGEAATAEEKKLRAPVEKRIEALAVAEAEFRKLEDRYVADLLAFATARVGKDNGAASLALTRILAVRPDYPAALSLRERMGVAPAEGDAPPSDSPPLKDVKTWKDYLAERRFTLSTITYVDRLMIVDTGTERALKVTPQNPIDSGPAFVYETEYHVTKVHHDEWFVGLTIAEEGADCLTIYAGPRQIAVSADGPTVSKTHAKANLDPEKADGWHRLTVVVKGKRLEVWLDGKSVITHEFTDREHLRGLLGIFHQGCRAEHRILRSGAL